MVELTTAAAVFDALNGVRSVAELTGRNYDAAYNWKRFGQFPSDTFVVMQAALADRGMTAPPSLWRMVPS
jgi:hypothetical protein